MVKTFSQFRSSSKANLYVRVPAEKTQQPSEQLQPGCNWYYADVSTMLATSAHEAPSSNSSQQQALLGMKLAMEPDPWRD